MPEELTEAQSTEMAPVALEMLDTLNETGLEQAEAEISISYLSLIQASSNELKPNHDKYMEDAKQGQFVDSVTKQLFDARTLKIAPFYYFQQFVEWSEDSDRPVGRHDGNSPIVAQSNWDGVEKGLVTPHGTVLKESRNFAVLILEEGKLPRPGIMAFRATAIAEAKRLLTLFNLDVFTSPSTGEVKKTPMFANTYTLSHESRSKDSNSWLVPTFADKTPAAHNVVQAAMQAHQTFTQSGLLKTATVEEKPEYDKSHSSKKAKPSKDELDKVIDAEIN